MPAFSLYLTDSEIDRVRREAKRRNLPVSGLIRQAIVTHLAAPDRQANREAFLQMVREKHPLRGTNWEHVHTARTMDHACRD